jgi:uncharacterized phage infection (PIP) family protein YhgE
MTNIDLNSFSVQSFHFRQSPSFFNNILFFLPFLIIFNLKEK